MDSLSLSSVAHRRSQALSSGLADCPVHVSRPHTRAMGQTEPEADVLVVNELKEAKVMATPLSTTEASPPISPRLVPISHAHVAENATVTALPRYNSPLSGVSLYNNISPTSSVVPTEYNTRSPSPALDNSDASNSLPSLRWRLASGYFACFVIGWADGGTC